MDIPIYFLDYRLESCRTGATTLKILWSITWRRTPAGSILLLACAPGLSWILKFTYLGKAEVFKPPFGFIFRWLGGVPVERSEHHNLVEQVVKMFDEHETFILALSPEGTRAYVPKWKTGFYYIALGAQVPIVLGYIDFPKKTAGIGPVFYPTGDIDKDIETIKDFYRPIKGKHPERGVI